MGCDSIVEKKKKHLQMLTSYFSMWLDVHLFKSDNWWNEVILSSLSENQKKLIEDSNIKILAALKMPELLRIANKNWYTLSHNDSGNTFLYQSLRDMFALMLSLCHRLNCNVGGKNVSDLELIYDFASSIDCEKSFLNDIQSTINSLKYERSNEANCNKPETPKEKPSTSSREIRQGDTVRLKSNPKINGGVMAVNKVGDRTKYMVFTENTTKEFFDDQIELLSSENQPHSITADKLKQILTSLQILNPSNSSLYSLNAAKIDFVPYQFRPVLKLIKSESPRLLIADGVGVGKTIEAGLILKELQARTPLDVVIIICPKPLVSEHKWENEMKEKFGESFVPAKSSDLRQIIRTYERDGVWDSRYNRLIIPYSILNEKLLNGDGRKHSGLLGMNPPPYIDLLIVDEAHNIRNSYTQSHQVVKFFCEHATAITFLTATPIQLGSNDLFTLLNLLFPDVVIDNASFEAMAQPNAYINKAVSLLRSVRPESEVVEVLQNAANTSWGQSVIAKNPIYKNVLLQLEKGIKSKENRLSVINEVELLHSFSHMINRTRRQDIGDFCVRRVHSLNIDFTAQQKELHDELLDFERRMLKRIHNTTSAKFLMATISRQASSSLYGIAPFVGAMVERRFEQLIEEFDDYTDDMSFEIEEYLDDIERIRNLAETLPPDDPKFNSVRDILKARRGVKTIIFSSFRHTLNYLHGRIKEELDLRVEQVHGGVGDEERFVLRNRFMLPANESNAIDVLLFSDIGSEGLDYQFCDTMINYDLPWNPMRIEQRIGRIDRRGQQSEVVHIYNCVVSGTIDAEIYNRCFMRIGIFEQSLGECSEILGNIERSIKDIVFESNLTDDERSQKFEKMAENEINLMRENLKLEEESKDIFGINMTDFSSEISRADNPWICAYNIKNLIIQYFEECLGSDKIFISNNKLSLSPIEKQIILSDYNELDCGDKNYEAYLKNIKKDRVPIVFSQEDARSTRFSLFINPLHPLARQAAMSVKSETAQIALKISGDEIAKGTYPFLLYSWQYVGVVPRTEFVTVCDDLNVEKELITIIQYASSVEPDSIAANSTFDYSEKWRPLEERHADLWETARNDFANESMTKSAFKLESLKRSLAAQTANPRKQLVQNPDPRISLMYRSQIERLELDYETKKKRIEETARKADIHFSFIVKGVLVNE